jgi:hypothetical protein
VAKPSENTSRDETAALAGRVAMWLKTWQRRLVADIRVGRDIDPLRRIQDSRTGRIMARCA